MDLWGIRRRPVPNQFGEYAEPVDSPYARMDDCRSKPRLPLAQPRLVRLRRDARLCARYPDKAIGAGSFGVQDFINGVAFGRGVEQVLMDIAEENPVYLYIVERRHRFYMEYIERTLQAAGGRIDLVLCGDDFGTQRGPLISPAAFDRLFAPKKKELFDLVHSLRGQGDAPLLRLQPGADPAIHRVRHGRPADDPGARRGNGSVWTQTGFRRQARAARRSRRARLAAARHAAGDRREVDRLMDEVGRGGGYILGPSHQLQPDTPIENVLTVYRTVARRRGVTL